MAGHNVKGHRVCPVQPHSADMFQLVCQATQEPLTLVHGAVLGAFCFFTTVSSEIKFWCQQNDCALKKNVFALEKQSKPGSHKETFRILRLDLQM